MARALAPDVRVVGVAPGWMDTPWLDRYVPRDRIAALRSNEEPTVGVALVAGEVVRLVAEDAPTGEVVQLTPEA